MLVQSEGDIYLLEDLSKPKLTRLTKTDERESQVAFLPDGSGYTVRREDTVLQTVFGTTWYSNLLLACPPVKD